MMKKRLIAVLMCLMMVTGLLAGCSNGGNNNGNTGGDEPQQTQSAPSDNGGDDQTADNNSNGLDYEGVTLTVVLAQGWDTPGREALFEKYTEKTGVKFDVQMLPDDMASELIKTKFATEELPDIIVNSGSVLEHTYMLPEERLVDLSDEPWVDQLISSESFAVDGKIWGIPLGGQGFFAFAVNTEVFKSVGLEIPQSKEELEQCFEVLKENGIQPMYLGSKDPWLVGNMTSGAIQKALDADPDLIDKLNTNQITYSEIPGFIEVLDDLRRWNELGYLGDNTMADSWDGHYQAFAEGQCAVTIGLTTWDVTLEEKYPGSTANVEMIPYYIGDSDTFFAGTTAQWYIPKSSKNIEIAKDFFRFIAKEDNLNEFYSAMGEASTPWKGVEVECLEPTKQLIEKLNSGQYGYHFGHNSLVQGQDFDGLCKLTQEALIGNMTAEEAAQQYDQMRSQIAKALNMEGF